MDSAYEKIEVKRNYLPLTIIVLLYIFLTFCVRYLLVTDELYAASLAKYLPEQQINYAVEASQNWSWLGYLLLPLLLLGKFVLVASVLATGYYVVSGQWVFRPFFRTAIIAEFIMLVPIIIKIFWFSMFHATYNLHELQSFSPLSISNLFKPSEVENWLEYPLQAASLFEVAYLLLLVVGVRQLVGLSWGRASSLVALSYGPALVIWLLLVMFMAVSAS